MLDVFSVYKNLNILCFIVLCDSDLYDGVLCDKKMCDRIVLLDDVVSKDLLFSLRYLFSRFVCCFDKEFIKLKCMYGMVCGYLFLGEMVFFELMFLLFCLNIIIGECSLGELICSFFDFEV